MLTSKVGEAVCGQAAAPHLYDGHYRAVHFVPAASSAPLTIFNSTKFNKRPLGQLFQKN